MNRRPGVLIAALLLAVAACGGSSDDESSSDDKDAHHGAGEAPSETEDPYDVEVPASAPDVPDAKALADDGFDCREAPNGRGATDPDEKQPWLAGQSHRVCLLSDGTIGAYWDLIVYKDTVVGMRYVAVPMGSTERPELTTSHKAALRTVFERVLPEDRASVGPAIAEWTTPADTDTWDFEGTGHAAFGGTGFMDFKAQLVDLPESMTLADAAGSDEPTLDPTGLQEAASEAGHECTVAGETLLGTRVQCDFGDVFSLSVSAFDDGPMSTFSITPWVDFTPKQTRDMVKELQELGDLSDSASFATWLDALCDELTDGRGERLVWIGGLPTHLTQSDTSIKVEAKIPFTGPS